MQTYHWVHLQLEKRDRNQIAGVLNRGRESTRVLRRALILRQLDQGQAAAQVAGSVQRECGSQDAAGDRPSVRG